MDARYWDNSAQQYDHQVTDAFTHGRSNILSDIIERLSSPELQVADFGCGPGKRLPFLSSRFRCIYGYDFSDQLLQIARSHCEEFLNVKIVNVDLCGSLLHLPKVDLAISLNTAIMPDADRRLTLLQGIAARLDTCGHLLLDVPSSESLLYSTFRETEWYRKLGYPTRKAEKTADVSCISRPRMLAQGVFYGGGEPTKHYLREELIVLVREVMKLDLLDIFKMEYDWKTEMEAEGVPEWMADPYPWDWLVVARTRG